MHGLRGQFSLVARFLFRASAVSRTLLKNKVHVLKPVVVPLPAPTKDFLPIQPPKGRKSAGCVAGGGATHAQPCRRFFHHLITLFLKLTGFFCVSARYQNVFRRVNAAHIWSEKCAPPLITARNPPLQRKKTPLPNDFPPCFPRKPFVLRAGRGSYFGYLASL